MTNKLTQETLSIDMGEVKPEPPFHLRCRKATKDRSKMTPQQILAELNRAIRLSIN